MSNDNTTTKNVNELPDWARAQISEANEQAAKRRVERNEARDEAKQLREEHEKFLKTIEELEAEKEESRELATAARAEVERLKAAISAGIETENLVTFSSLLQGESPEQLHSHAEELKKLFNSGDKPSVKVRATDPTQGMGSSHTPLNGDPILQAVLSTLNK